MRSNTGYNYSHKFYLSSVKMASEKSLKARNAFVIVGVLTADALAIFLIQGIPTQTSTAVWFDWTTKRLALAVLLPTVVLLLSSLLPSSIKATLVFWRLKDPLPGCRAFDDETLSDPRIDKDRLRKNVGEFPIDAKSQNTMWYRLFKKVENVTEIRDVHGRYLLLRDIASISALIVVMSLAAYCFDWVAYAHAKILIGVLIGQYLLSSLSAKALGKGFVTSVLALHGVKRRV